MRRRTHKSRFRDAQDNAAERARHSTLDDGSVSIPARPTGVETNRRRH